MKEKRHNFILDIINEYDIETQEELVNKLRSNGFNVTQATISRDIKELHLIKVQSQSGAYKYAINDNKSAVNTEKLLKVLRNTVLSVEKAANLVVVKTLPGSAGAAAEVIDNMNFDGIAGTIAGDNTLFVAATCEDIADITVVKLKQLIK